MDLLHRIRWANVARAAALAAAVLLVVAWPRLRAEPPPLPSEPQVEEVAAAPAGGEELAFEAERPPEVEEPPPGEEADASASPVEDRRAGGKRRAGGESRASEKRRPGGERRASGKRRTGGKRRPRKERAARPAPGPQRAAGGADPVAEVPLSTGATGSVAAGAPRSGPPRTTNEFGFENAP